METAMAERTFRVVLQELADGAQSPAEKGQSFERLVKAFLEQDKQRAAQFARVWPWADYPHNRGQHDVGIDLVAEERDTGAHVAIQCKFYAPGTQVDLADVNQLLGAYARPRYASGILISTSDNWTRHAENALEGLEKPVQRWGPEVFENSSIDWQDFRHDRPSVLTKRETKQLHDYQQAALDDVLIKFGKYDRGKLIMACGSGKTFTALRIAEQVAGAGGAVLFLTPSISLLGQSLIDWANDADLPLKALAVCSDIKAGKRRDDEDISPYDLTAAPSTDPAQLAARFKAAAAGQLKAVFSTYQSLDRIHQAQRENGLPEFDLIICDEAHRTTGVKGTKLTGRDESGFQRIHDDKFISGKKRLYMTATPRIYGDQAKRKANESQLTIASMDDEAIYGPEFHRLGFGRAVDLGILSDYKVVIFNVDYGQVAANLGTLLPDSSNDVNMNNGARMIGCWNGLGKRAAYGVDFGDDAQPVKRAVAFSNTINQSKDFAQYFGQVIETCINADVSNTGNRLTCQVKHVDGTQNALTRSKMLSWLKEGPADGVCRILSNARCLTEGIDVPALDAILFLHPRKSEIDVVQAVGRVMRKSEGKQLGYIIIPIAQEPGATPQGSVNSSAYKAVWQVINAISSHDDRFEAKINQLALASDKPKEKSEYKDDKDIGGGKESGSQSEPDDPPTQPELPFEIDADPAWRDAILAKVVDKYADPGYWERWAVNIRDIAARHEARIRALLQQPESEVRPVFDQFLAGLRRNLNDGISENDAIGMLSQHLISKPVFDALFADYAFSGRNPVSQAMEAMLHSLEQRGLEKETAELNSFYRDVQVSVRGITGAAAKQQVIANLYQRFFRLALADAAKQLGIVYTPTEVVDYILRSVEDVLRQEFNASLSDAGVHILDPFVGTGTFITRLLQSGLIRPPDLERKYREELHANDIMLLAYYIAAVNIEAAYHDAAQPAEYQPFEGICLTDTFQSYEPDDPMDAILFPRNNQRIERQKGLDIRVIIGNPPWSVYNNRSYASVDAQVQQSYAKASSARNLVALYDPYVKALRLSANRVMNSEHGGIVAFVTNGGFIDSNAFDGFRKAIASEFDAIYCYNLRGDQRTAGEKSRQEAGKIFGSGSRTGVAIVLLVKKPGQSDGAKIYYRDVGDYISREGKLAILEDGRLATTEWQIITPNEHGDWIGQRSAAYESFWPLTLDNGSPEVAGVPAIFNRQTPGLKTARDVYLYASSKQQLQTNVGKISENPLGDGMVATSLYRPFFKQNLCFSPGLISRIRDFPNIYPNADSENFGISLVDKGSDLPFHCLITNGIADQHLTSATAYFPRYRYIPARELTRPPDKGNPELERVSNINPLALAQFQAHYGDAEISEDDLFYYTYGMLHCPQWRTAFASDLSKVAVRIPVAKSVADFHDFAAAGRKLAELHIHYESVEPYPLLETHSPNWNPKSANAYRIEKMAYGGPTRHPDKTVIVCNAGITLSGIPAEAHEYRLGSRSALDWLIERYQVRSDPKSGIVNDPNDWAAEQVQPRYIVDLVKRITRVSLETNHIVQHLPYLPIESNDRPSADKETFQLLADEWEQETAYQSSTRQIKAHPAYQKITRMGTAAIPWALERLQQPTVHWFLVLRAITSVDPVSPQARGNLAAMVEAWIAWGKGNGYG